MTTPGTYDRAYFVRIDERGRWRTIREVSAMLTGGIVATPQGIAMVRLDAQSRTDVWLLGYDGRMRALTPLVAGIDGLLFNGRRLVFSIEGCIFTGPIPAPGAPLEPIAAEGCVRS